MQTVRIGNPSLALCRLTLHILQTIDPGAQPKEAGKPLQALLVMARAMVERLLYAPPHHRHPYRSEILRENVGIQFLSLRQTSPSKILCRLTSAEKSPINTGLRI